ncbi:MAG: FtsW/RodA/SpoVE family cell cycle protein [Simkaniaceae bacterium]
MWNHEFLKRLDLRLLLVVFFLMLASLITISAASLPAGHSGEESFFTPLVKSQMQWFLLGWGVFCFFVGFDYQKLREWTWILYLIMILVLLGLFFTSPIQNVRRWYRIPFINFAFQPSEYAKLVVVLSLSWYLEKKGKETGRLGTSLFGGIIVLFPFLLILKQPDLGTAMVLFPITLAMFYIGEMNRKIILAMTICGGLLLALISSIFLGVIPYEDLRPYATKFIKDYQFERFNPDTHHQKAAQTAIALGRGFGKGFRKSEFTGKQFLPAAPTDSVFPAFTEEFGIIGAYFLLFLYGTLIYLGFQVTAVAKDKFGRFLSMGITVYLAVHVIVNIGMMCGLLPITGVPLILMTYGGSSILSTMTALGILQSIYTRRFMF